MDGPLLNKLASTTLEWVPSPTGAPGCFGKKVFAYGAEGLGRDGRARDYTTLYRFDAGSRYPAWRIARGGACEIWVLDGILEVNGELVAKDEWVQLLPNEEGWFLGSTSGCQVLAIVRGHIELLPPASEP
jgi:hypothetical protein